MGQKRISGKLFLACACLEAKTVIPCPSPVLLFPLFMLEKRINFFKKILWCCSHPFLLYGFPHLGCAAFLRSKKQKSRAVEEERQHQRWVWWVVRGKKEHQVRLELMGDPENKIVFQVGICEVLALHKKAPAPRAPGPINSRLRNFKLESGIDGACGDLADQANQGCSPGCDCSAGDLQQQPQIFAFGWLYLELKPC